MQKYISQFKQKQSESIKNIRWQRKPLVQLIESTGATVGESGEVSRCVLCGETGFASIFQDAGGWRYGCHVCVESHDVISLNQRLNSMSTLVNTLGGGQ